MPKRATPGGMPDTLKASAELLSGIALDDVQVRRNSPRPAALDAGSDSTDAETHRPHEAWNVVQQEQGRVKSTSATAGTPINQLPDLEHAADHLAKATARATAPDDNGTPR